MEKREEKVKWHHRVAKLRTGKGLTPVHNFHNGSSVKLWMTLKCWFDLTLELV